jgi:phosphoglycolate phosphatase
MSYEAVIWDVDGTLLNTLQDQADATNAALIAFDYPPHPADAYRYLIGGGLRRLIEGILPDDVAPTEDIIAQLSGEYKLQYEEHWNKTTAPYDGVPETLDILKTLNVPMAVLSNKPEAFLHKVVAEFLSRWTFQVVIGQRDDMPHKPDPAGIFAILEQLGLEASQAIYVGDTPGDIETALNAGVKAVGVEWGFRSREELLRAGADVVLKNPVELLNLL